jgi:hypothetical protein
MMFARWCAAEEVVATLVALASAGNIPMDGMMQMMMQTMMNSMSNTHHEPAQTSGGCTSGNCQVPQGVDVGQYMEQQKQQQQYEQTQMAEKIKAQFESVMKQVTMRKHRYAMSVMTEFTTMCACLKESYTIYQSMFVENAKRANLTDIVGLDDLVAKMPYNAATAKEARELVFAGMLNALCTSLGEFMIFAQTVENNIPVYQNNPVTNPPNVG